jgi:hypothetical protein
MRAPARITVVCGILAVLFLTFAYSFANLPYFTVWHDHQQRIYTRADSPALFWIPAAVGVVVGIAMLLLAYHLHFRVQLARASLPVLAPVRWLGVIFINIALVMIVAALIAGAFHR